MLNVTFLSVSNCLSTLPQQPISVPVVACPLSSALSRVCEPGFPLCEQGNGRAACCLLLGDRGTPLQVTLVLVLLILLLGVVEDGGIRNPILHVPRAPNLKTVGMLFCSHSFGHHTVCP